MSFTNENLWTLLVKCHCHWHRYLNNWGSALFRGLKNNILSGLSLQGCTLMFNELSVQTFYIKIALNYVKMYFSIAKVKILIMILLLFLTSIRLHIDILTNSFFLLISVHIFKIFLVSFFDTVTLLSGITYITLEIAANKLLAFFWYILNKQMNNNTIICIRNVILENQIS
jgi:hypothetical protein